MFISKPLINLQLCLNNRKCLLLFLRSRLLLAPLPFSARRHVDLHADSVSKICDSRFIQRTKTPVNKGKFWETASRCLFPGSGRGQRRTINTWSHILKGTPAHICISILVHLCDLSKEGKKKRKCVTITPRGVNIIGFNEGTSFPVVNVHHWDN